jgi:hypothetical protein
LVEEIEPESQVIELGLMKVNSLLLRALPFDSVTDKVQEVP